MKDKAKEGCRASRWVLENRDVQVAVDKKTGTIRSMFFRKRRQDLFQLLDQNMEGRAGYLRVYDELDCRSYNELADRCRLVSATKRGNRITLKKQFVGAPFVLIIRMTLDETSLVWEVQAEKKNRKVKDRSLRVGFNMPLKGGWDVWAPCSDGNFTFDGMDSFNFNHVQVTFVSPREIILPMVSHYSRDMDVGYSILKPIGDRVPATRFQYENGEKLFNWGYNRKPVQKSPTLEVLNYYIGLVGDRPMKTRVEMVFHEGDWRPGVGKVYNKYREYFDCDADVMHDMAGCFRCGNIDVGKDPQASRKQGLKTLEVHGHFSYYGDYLSEGQDQWTKGVYERVYRAMGAAGKGMDTHEVYDWVNSHGPEEWAAVIYGPDWKKQGINPERDLLHRRKEMKKLLDRIRKAGIYPFWYFNYSDGFRPVAEERWPDAISLDQDGKPMGSGWCMAHNMNADPSTSFGKFCDKSIVKILECYPELAGFFLDCFRHYEVEYGHDDGITVCDNRPAYSINFSYDWITRRMKEHMRRLGKKRAIFANKPQTIRSLRYVDGMLLEGDGDMAEEKYFWACIAKPGFFMWTTSRHGTDENLRRTLLHGCYPKVAEGCTEMLPMYEQFKRRVLCFEPDPLRVPHGAKGKLFTVGSHYVASVVTPLIQSEDSVKYARTPYALFRVKRGADIGRVGVMYPGDKKMRKVNFKFNGSIIAVPLRDYKNCAVVKLFVTRKTGKKIGPEKFTGPVDFCGDPESSFQDVSDR